MLKQCNIMTEFKEKNNIQSPWANNVSNHPYLKVYFNDELYQYSLN